MRKATCLSGLRPRRIGLPALLLLGALAVCVGSGALSAASGSPFGASITQADAAEDPGSQYVFVANSGSNNVSVYVMGSGGVIVQGQGSPYSTTGTAPVAQRPEPCLRFELALDLTRERMA